MTATVRDRGYGHLLIELHVKHIWTADFNAVFHVPLLLLLPQLFLMLEMLAAGLSSGGTGTVSLDTHDSHDYDDFGCHHECGVYAQALPVHLEALEWFYSAVH